MKKIIINQYYFWAVFSFMFLMNSCSKEDQNPQFTPGKNNFTISVDGTERSYVVHVPARYSGNESVPMVIFCHGSGQSGDQFYNISGWKEVGDTANFLTVFPTALVYCTVEDGVTENKTKWNSFPGGSEFCPGQNKKDDVKFISEMITQLERIFKVDAKRIYMAGFSNGGQFTATCAIQISDRIAAVISCGGGGSFPTDTIYTPVRKLPVMLMFGNQDGKLLKKLGLPDNASVPMGFDSLYTLYPQLYFAQVKPYINNFELDENNYTIGGDNNPITFANYSGKSGDPNNVFLIAEVKGLIHEYPNGKNYPLNGAVYHWDWFKKYQLP